jgi:8-oxo-dGTP pyrophosphatase MutT (NUDIX family)/phosphohistidine phosphatase SixA
VITAAGGAVWRPAAGGIEVTVVHRPRYDDWSLPKGKLHAGEPAAVGAAREVEEETGFTPQVQRWLARMSYLVAGEPKVVDYWAMRCLDGAFAANDEVDEIRWLPPADAAAILTRDRQVLDALLSRPVDTTAVLLVRHARAGNKRDWPGDDRLRPLDGTGRRQAETLAEMLPVFRPARVLAADRVRCVDTVGPLATRLGLKVEIDPVFNEAKRTDAERVVARVRALASAGQPVVVCSQGGVIPGALSSLAEESGTKLGSPSASKGSVWALSLDRTGRLAGVDYYPPTARGRPATKG